MLIIGHRGARLEAPENTLAGFWHGIGLGLQAVEFDIRLSRDRQLVVIHDATVDRTTDRTGNVRDFTATELAGMDACAAHPDWPERVGIPTLAEVLDVVGTLPRILIELKHLAPADLEIIAQGIVQQIVDRGLERQVRITSFSLEALECVREIAPGQALGLIGREGSPAFLTDAVRLGCTQVDLNLEASTPEQYAEAHALGLEVVAWPVNTPEAFAEATTRHADMICTDTPTAILRLSTL